VAESEKAKENDPAKLSKTSLVDIVDKAMKGDGSTQQKISKKTAAKKEVTPKSKKDGESKKPSETAKGKLRGVKDSVAKTTE